MSPREDRKLCRRVRRAAVCLSYLYGDIGGSGGHWAIKLPVERELAGMERWRAAGSRLTRKLWAELTREGFTKTAYELNGDADPSSARSSGDRWRRLSEAYLQKSLTRAVCEDFWISLPSCMKRSTLKQESVPKAKCCFWVLTSAAVLNPS